MGNSERPIIRSIFVASTQKEAEEVAAPALNYLFTELYGAASAAGERTLKAMDGTVITDKTQVGFGCFKNRYIVGTPEFAIEQFFNVREGGISNRSNLLDASTRISGKDSMKSK